MSQILVISSSSTIFRKIRRWVKQNLIPRHEYIFLTETFPLSAPEDQKNNYYLSDFSNRKAVQEKINKLHKIYSIERVLAFDEFAQFIKAEFLYLKSNNPECLKDGMKLRNKQVMKRVLQNHCLRVAKEYSYEELQSGQVKFPMVIKPKSLAGAVGVEILYHQCDLNNVLEQKDKFNFNENQYTDMSTTDYLAEEYVVGRKLHLDGLWNQQQEVICFTVSEYTHGDCFNYTKNAKPLASRVLSPIEFEYELAKSFAVKVLKSLSAPAQAFHLECFFTNEKELVFLELGMRVGGGWIPQSVKAIHKTDLELNHLRLQLGLTEHIPSKQKRSNYLNQVTAFLLYPKQHTSVAKLKVENSTTLPNTWCSQLKKVKWPDKNTLASGEFYSHEDCLAAFLFKGQIADVDSDLNWLSNNLKFTLVESI